MKLWIWVIFCFDNSSTSNISLIVKVVCKSKLNAVAIKIVKLIDVNTVSVVRNYLEISFQFLNSIIKFYQVKVNNSYFE